MNIYLWGFSILVILLDKLVLGIFLDLSTVFSVSVLWLDLDLSNDLTLSYLLLLGVSTILLDACYLSVLLTVSIFCFADIGGVMASFAKLCFVFPFLSTICRNMSGYVLMGCPAARLETMTLVIHSFVLV